MASGDAPGRSGFLPARTIHLHPTRLCNLTCRHCYSHSSPHRRSHLDLATLLRALAALRGEGYEQLSVSGGEPLLYPRLDALVSAAQDQGYRLSLITNGSTITPANVPLLASLDFVAVSVDGREPLHNQIRGQKDAFARTMRGLRRLREAGARFAIIFAATRQSLVDIVPVAEIAMQHGAVALHLRPLVLTGRAAANCGDLGLRQTDLDRLFLIAHALRHELGKELAIQLDLVPASAALANRCAYRALAENSDGPLSDLINPLVISADGVAKPLTYDFPAAYDICTIDDLCVAGRGAIVPERLNAFRITMLDALGKLDPEAGLLDWFFYLTGCAAASEKATA
ncbi:radical SAM protein [Methylocystis parvus]|uniref:radical SAM protein n=1 Tax=Methylocystis parvus TaxID=134 RepID=UPI0012F93C4E|nr:radical SAM protein [Methylocystis parvus]WBK01120.1 radical SAM protein [Methylocystis parvus OBBP]